ncbi:bifunctional oligoribonuclease/PAP phosphatase NrnA [Euzebyella marina]|uniref:Bifunctional oligoribonuclease/PAP phosphatase NrnA n=1 Tax=Euzebyella marina TaxID=1761453 RepID=A0A3G2L8K1_9FLAO|nr:bifunctional oligoribonuclease/PAP phosphatase NrnA [Euzebyella marina]AYN68501.1 bifunctional oligoribonuclease/PAP phosphatase NrnA [Euzebyella marina]
MNSETINAVKELLSRPQKIVIVPHKNPDGDAIGSALALWHYLTGIGQETSVIVPNDYPKFLKWMPGCGSIINFERENTQAKEKIDGSTLIFTLDFNHLGRIGQMEKPLQEKVGQIPFVMIDHHQAPSDYAEVMYSDVNMSSTCQMVYNFIESIDTVDKVTPEIANCLYTGIMTDTGSFKFRSTNGRTHRIVADLIDRGAENTEIHHRVFDTNTPERLRLLGCALNNLVILKEYRTAYITLSQQELDAHNFQKGDTEGFVNYGLTLEDVIFAVIFIENKEEGIIKISLRSIGDFSVNEFARNHFDGGGHNNAAGGRSELSLEDTATHFESLLKNYQAQLRP